MLALIQGHQYAKVAKKSQSAKYHSSYIIIRWISYSVSHPLLCHHFPPFFSSFLLFLPIFLSQHLILVKNRENFRVFLKISREKFGGSVWNAYLCIRFRTEALQPTANRSLKGLHEDREVVQESRRLAAPSWRKCHPAAGRDTSRSIFFEGAFGSMRRSVLGQDRTAGAANAAEAFEDTNFTMESLILAQDER